MFGTEEEKRALLEKLERIRTNIQLYNLLKKRTNAEVAYLLAGLEHKKSDTNRSLAQKMLLSFQKEEPERFTMIINMYTASLEYFKKNATQSNPHQTTTMQGQPNEKERSAEAMGPEPA